MTTQQTTIPGTHVEPPREFLERYAALCARAGTKPPRLELVAAHEENGWLFACVFVGEGRERRARMRSVTGGPGAWDRMALVVFEASR